MSETVYVVVVAYSTLGPDTIDGVYKDRDRAEHAASQHGVYVYEWELGAGDAFPDALIYETEFVSGGDPE